MTGLIRKIKSYTKHRLTALIVLIVYLIAGLGITAGQISFVTEKDSIDRLREGAVRFSDLLYQNIMKDREQLEAIAEFAGDTMDDSYSEIQEMLSGIEHHGMITYFQVLLPNGVLLTEYNQYDISAETTFEKEAAIGKYVSDRTDCFINDNKVVRNAVPMVQDGVVTGMLYGVIESYQLQATFRTQMYNGEAQLYIIDGKTGEYIFIQPRANADLIGYEPQVWEEGFNEEQLDTALGVNASGYTTYRTEDIKERIYMAYSPVGVNDWYAAIVVPESAVFSAADKVINAVKMMGVYSTIGVAAYLASIIRLERGKDKRIATVVEIQGMLLEARRNADYVKLAMSTILERQNAAVVFLLNFDAGAYTVDFVSNERILPIFEGKRNDRDLQEELAVYSKNHARGGILYKSEANRYPHIGVLLEELECDNIVIAPAITADKEVDSLIGVVCVNRESDTLTILINVATNFALAIRDIKYLENISAVTFIDGLTGTLNRLKYNDRLQGYGSEMPDSLATVFIDVDGLRAVNNRLGHDYGDAMLKSIAESIVDVFSHDNVYRIGGDEFVAILDNISEDEVKEMVKLADEKIIESGYRVSIGYEWGENGDIETMIKSAEQMMYEEKRHHYAGEE